MYVFCPYNGAREVLKMAVKAKRIEVRAEEATLDRIQQAASAVHEQTSEFVRKAALQRAEEVLRNELVTMMEPEQFDKLMACLDAADDAPRLAAATRRPAVFTRR
jgi:uncharacterized protein (DUF1778 family)